MPAGAPLLTWGAALRRSIRGLRSGSGTAPSGTLDRQRQDGSPSGKNAANLTPGEGSALLKYKDAAQFTAMLRSGKRPDGTPVQVMPFSALSKMNDVDAQALYAYLKTIPSRPQGQR